MSSIANFIVASRSGELYSTDLRAPSGVPYKEKERGRERWRGREREGEKDREGEREREGRCVSMKNKNKKRRTK